MPVFLVGLGAGLVGGFVVGDGVDAGSRLMKWATVAGVGYVAYKAGVPQAIARAVK